MFASAPSYTISVNNIVPHILGAGVEHVVP